MGLERSQLDRRWSTDIVTQEDRMSSISAEARQMSPIVQRGDSVANMRTRAWTGVLPPSEVCALSSNQQVQWPLSSRLPWMVRSVSMADSFLNVHPRFNSLPCPAARSRACLASGGTVPHRL